MKAARFSHVAVETVEQAAMLLADPANDARLIAGGQSLMPMLNFRLAQPALLVDLNRVDGLAGIEDAEDGGLRIGAMTRTRAVETSPLVASRQPLLREAVPHIAHLSIRNRGTIGGSLSHADPAAEFPALTVALDATMTLQSLRGARQVPAADFFDGIFSTALAPDEILTRIDFPAWPKERLFAFKEFSRRRGDFALAGIAFWADVEDGACTRARVVAFGVSDRPQRLNDAEDALTGHALNDPAARATALDAARAALHPDSDLHASADYRRDLTATMLDRAVTEANGARIA